VPTRLMLHQCLVNMTGSDATVVNFNKSFSHFYMYFIHNGKRQSDLL
jgi:hypothetical protein